MLIPVLFRTPLIEATSFLLYGSTIYFLSLTTNNLFNLLRKPLYLRLTSYAGFFAVCTLSFLQLRDDIYGWRGRKGLRATLDLDDSYLEGAKEYIKKRLAINRTIAKLLGIKRGDKEFTIAGDEKRTLMGFRDLALMKQLELVDAWESLKEPPPPQRSN